MGEVFCLAIVLSKVEPCYALVTRYYVLVTIFVL